MSKTTTKIRAEMHADLAAVRAQLSRCILTYDLTLEPMPEGMRGIITPAEWASTQAELLAYQMGLARNLLAAPSWITRCMPATSRDQAREVRP